MIEVSNICKSFGKEQVLKDVNFQLPPNETLSVLGKSGCGKTTLLKILAGLEAADVGSFTIDGENMLDKKPQSRGVVYLSQAPLLFPHLNVWENIAFGLRIRKLEEKQVFIAVEEMLINLDLTSQAKKMPTELSGGQKQRVSFGRAIIIQPRILLLDEPFGSLDAQTRAEMQMLFRHLREAYRTTSLFITHDLKEALMMGTRIGRMEAGQLSLFSSIKEFAQSEGSGAKEELAFWEKMMIVEPPQTGAEGDNSFTKK